MSESLVPKKNAPRVYIAYNVGSKWVPAHFVITCFSPLYTQRQVEGTVQGLASTAQKESEIQRRCHFSILGPDEDSEYNSRLSKDDS